MSGLEVCEIFYSLQGESTHAGRPCIFIRLSQCNLRCSWCDTQYAGAPGQRMTIDAILAEVTQYPARLVEITGGEPLLQDDILELIGDLHHAGYEILLETNGSLYLGELPDYVAKIVDVKCPGSGCAGSFMKWNLRFLNPKDELKFVLTNYPDFRYALKFIQDNGLQDRIILFSPVTSVLPAATLADWMLIEGVTARLQLQLHKILQLP